MWIEWFVVASTYSPHKGYGKLIHLQRDMMRRWGVHAQLIRVKLKLAMITTKFSFFKFKPSSGCVHHGTNRLSPVPHTRAHLHQVKCIKPMLPSRTIRPRRNGLHILHIHAGLWTMIRAIALFVRPVHRPTPALRTWKDAKRLRNWFDWLHRTMTCRLSTCSHSGLGFFNYWLWYIIRITIMFRNKSMSS